MTYKNSSACELKYLPPAPDTTDCAQPDLNVRLNHLTTGPPPSVVVHAEPILDR